MDNYSGLKEDEVLAESVPKSFKYKWLLIVPAVIFLLIGFALFPISTHFSETSGRVVDENGAGIEGVSVRVSYNCLVPSPVDSGSHRSIHTENSNTDSDGNFYFPPFVKARSSNVLTSCDQKLISINKDGYCWLANQPYEKMVFPGIGCRPGYEFGRKAIGSQDKQIDLSLFAIPQVKLDHIPRCSDKTKGDDECMRMLFISSGQDVTKKDIIDCEVFSPLNLKDSCYRQLANMFLRTDFSRAISYCNVIKDISKRDSCVNELNWQAEQIRE